MNLCILFRHIYIIGPCERISSIVPQTGGISQAQEKTVDQLGWTPDQAAFEAVVKLSET